MKKRFSIFLLISAMVSASLFLYLHYRVTPGLDLDKVIVFEKSGKSTTASMLHRKKGFVLHFFASWCLDCRKEMPKMIAASTYFEQMGYSIYAVTDENINEIHPYINNLDSSSIQYLQLDRAFKMIDINAIPSTFIFNATNDEIYSKVGRVKWDDKKWLDKVLK